MLDSGMMEMIPEEKENKMTRKLSKRLAALVLACAIVICMIPAKADASMMYLSSLEPTGNVKFDEFINNPTYTDDAPWGRTQRPLLSKAGSTGCASYCADFVKYCYGIDGITSKDVFYDVNEIRAGDIIHVQSSYGHWFVVLKREGNMLYTAEGNWNDAIRICWGYAIVDNEIVGGRHAFDKGYHFMPAQTDGTWEKGEEGWRYSFGNGFYALNKWLNDGSNWYFAGMEGYLVTGWQQIDDKWYYFTPSGQMQKNWKKIDGKWYYFGSNGVMVKKWKQIDGKWYYFAGGAMVTGWKRLGGSWYYFSGVGVMQNEWKKIDGKWYYFDDGVMVTGTVIIDDTEYTFDRNGALVE